MAKKKNTVKRIDMRKATINERRKNIWYNPIYIRTIPLEPEFQMWTETHKAIFDEIIAHLDDIDNEGFVVKLPAKELADKIGLEIPADTTASKYIYSELSFMKEHSAVKILKDPFFQELDMPPIIEEIDRDKDHIAVAICNGYAAYFFDFRHLYEPLLNSLAK